MTTQARTRTCATCGDDFEPVRWTAGTYCGVQCQRAAHRNQSIVPAATQGIRKEPMTDQEMTTMLADIRDELIRAGKPLVRTDLMGYAEKAGRIVEAQREEHADGA